MSVAARSYRYTSRSSRSQNLESSASTPYSRIGSCTTNAYKFICAVVENRMREVGIAILNLTRPEVELSTFTDTHSYLNTLTKMMLYYPQEVLIPKTSEHSELHEAVASKYPHCKIVPIARKYFDETRGAKYISMLAIPGSTIGSEVNEKYLCLASLASLIKYVEFSQKLTFASRGLKITFVGREGTMMIDSTNLWNLEILQDCQGDSKVSLFSVINQTHTRSGDENTIKTRYDCMEEILNHENTYLALVALLKNFPNVDRIISCISTLDVQSTSDSRCQRNLSNLLHLKSLLEQIPKFRVAMKHCTNGLLQAMLRNFNDQRVERIHSQICELLHSDATPRKQHLEMITELCNAIKPGVNGLLDVARRTLRETRGDIDDLVEEYKTRLKLPDIQLQHGAKRGFHLKCGIQEKLPPVFIQVVKQKKCFKFSSEDLIELNQRLQNSTTEILQLTNRLVDELLHKIRDNIGCIYSINDTVSLLDLITSFATYVSLNPDCCRPQIIPRGPLRITKGRHPIISHLADFPFISNDTDCSLAQNFHLISGANMSGKSTYIRQIALITIMAQIGCYVTAEACTIRITDHLFSRIGTYDSLEENASSFMVEMREMAYILQNKTPNSLIIIDELGRGTSVKDGSSISWACCEQLIPSSCYTFFVTHYSQLIQLSALYNNVKLSYLDCSQEGTKISFHHRLKSGVDKLENYGIALAQHQAGFPDDVIEDAKRIAAYLQSTQEESSDSSSSAWVTAAQETYQVLQSLQSSHLDPSSLKDILSEVQKRLRFHALT